MKQLLTVASPPHWHCGRTAAGLFWNRALALAPVAALAVWNFGPPAARTMALACVAAVAVQAACDRLAGRELRIDDASALVTGLTLACLLPATAPWWLTAVGAAAAMVLGREIFGGPGSNPLVPACVGWAVCRLSWPDLMNVDFALLDTPFASPLSELMYFGAAEVAELPLADLVMGRQLGGLGAVQVLGVLIGGAWLLGRDVIRVWIPAGFTAGVFVAAWLFFATDPGFYAPPLFHLLAGGTLFGAFFLAPECGPAPTGRSAMFVYGLVGGALVMVIRAWGAYPDGTVFAVLLANLLTPALDRIRPRAFGKSGRRQP